MELEGFLEKLAATKDKYQWYLNHDYIRGKFKLDNGAELYVCPLTAVCHSEKGLGYAVFNHGMAAKEVGILDQDKRIADSADGERCLGPYDKDLRQKMLEVLGLNESVRSEFTQIFTEDDATVIP